MKEFLSIYKTEVIIAVIILIVMFVPYMIINSGIITSTSALLGFDTITRFFTPLIMGVLCGVIVYRAFKRNREEDR
ncbi:MAG: hypothetical protein IPM95_05420 [Sphingobacteriales bacterium]|jgi:hypothetical protein|nr:hypothetical protein [Sphingobacteriales bacterium]